MRRSPPTKVDGLLGFAMCRVNPAIMIFVEAASRNNESCHSTPPQQSEVTMRRTRSNSAIVRMPTLLLLTLFVGSAEVAAGTVTISGTVVTPGGKPVADAPVWMTRPASEFREEPERKVAGTYSYLYGETRTSDDGTFSFTVTDSELLKQFGPRADSDYPRGLMPCDVVTLVDGYAISSRHVSGARPFAAANIVLRKAEAIEGRVLGPDRQSLADLGYDHPLVTSLRL